MNLRIACFTLLLSLFPFSAHSAELDRYKFYIGDINSDGIDDLYVENKLWVPIGAGVSVVIPVFDSAYALMGTINGSYAEPVQLFSPLDKQLLQEIAVILYDFNGDGIDDVFIHSLDKYVNSVLLTLNADSLEVLQQFTEISGEKVSGEELLAVSNVEGSSVPEIVFPSGFIAEFSTTSGGFELKETAFSPSFPAIFDYAGLRGQAFDADVPSPLLAGVSANAAGSVSTGYQFALPPSLNGEAIGLGLSYTSRSGSRGYLPSGWSLSGFPVIYRCSKTLYLEGSTAGFEFDNSSVDAGGDSFCGMGGKLMPIEAGQQGLNGDFRYAGASKNWVSAGETEIKEYLPDGSFYTFEPHLWGDGLTSARNNVLIWRASKFTNTYGNETSFEYLSGKATPHPQFMKYQNVEVAFEYKSVPAISRQLGVGSISINTSNDSLLTGVKVEVAGTVRKNLSLGYEFTSLTDEPRLDFLQECGVSSAGIEECLPAVKFDYSDTSNEVYVTRQSDYLNSSAYADSEKRTTADLDADGIPDVVRVYGQTIYALLSSNDWAESAVLTGANRYAISPFDYNKDGKDDLLFLKDEGTKTVTYSKTFWEEVVKFSSWQPETWSPSAYEAEYGWSCSYSGSPVPMNGGVDHYFWQCIKLEQVVRQFTDYYRLLSWQIGFSTSNNAMAVANVGTKICVSESGFSNFLKQLDFMRPVSLDWNSDGNLDFIAVGDSGACEFGNKPSGSSWRLHLANGNGGFLKSNVTGVSGHSFAQPSDMDGNGKLDLLAIRAGGSVTAPYWQYVTNSGQTSGFSFKDVVVQNKYGNPDKLTADYSLPVDLNADGKQDFIEVVNYSEGVYRWVAHINSGNGFLPPQILSEARGVIAGADRKSKEDFNVRIIRYDGDEYPDVVVIEQKEDGSSNYIVYRSKVASGGRLAFEQIDLEQSSSSLSFKNVLIQDVDGDGINDIAELTSGGVNILYISRPGANLLTEVWQERNGLGERQDIASIDWVSPDQASAVYTHEYFSNSENMALYPRFPLVQSVSRPSPLSDGAGSPVSLQTEMDYDTFVVNKRGYGFLGPKSFKQEDELSRTESIFAVVPEHLEQPFLSLRETKAYDRRISDNRLVSRQLLDVEPRYEYYCGDGVFAAVSLPADQCADATKQSVSFYPQVSRQLSVSNDYSGAEISSTLVSRVFTDRGMLDEETTEVGYGAPDPACHADSSCFSLASVIHTKTTDPTQNHNHGVSEYISELQEESVSVAWENERAFLAPELPSGVSAADLVGGYSSITDYQWHSSVPVVEAVTVFKGTGREAEISISMVPASTALAGMEGQISSGSGITIATNTAAAHHPDFPGRGNALSGWQGGWPTKETVSSLGAAESMETTVSYDPLTGALLSAMDENGLETSYTRDFLGREKVVSMPSGESVTVTRNYCALEGCPAEIPSAFFFERVVSSSDTSVNYFNRLGAKVGSARISFSGSDVLETTVYDMSGRVVAQTLPHASCGAEGCSAHEVTTSHNDSLGNVVVKYPDGRSVLTETRANGVGGVQTSVSHTVKVPTLTDLGFLEGETPLVVKAVNQKLDVLGNIVFSEEVDMAAPEITLEEATETEPAVTGQPIITTEFAYDPRGNLTWSRVEGDNATVVARVYDVAGNMVREWDPNKGLTELVHNIYGELTDGFTTGLDGSSSRTFNVNYNGIGNVTTETSNGHVTTYSYENYAGISCGQNLLCNIQGPDLDGDGNHDVSETYEYYLTNGTKGAGQLASRSLEIHAAGMLARTFDFEYSYTISGQLERTNYPSGFPAVENAFTNGYLDEVRNANDVSKVWWDATAYDQFGAPSTISFGNGVVQNIVVDPNSGREIQRSAGLPGQTALVQGNTLAWDGLGRLAYRRSSADTAALDASVQPDQFEEFSHDGFGRIKAAVAKALQGAQAGQSVTQVYDYDNLGNLTLFDGATQVFAAAASCGYGGSYFPGPHAIGSESGVDYCYNAFGELTSAGTRQYLWNAEHTAPSAVIDGADSVYFTYGPLGELRYQKETISGVTTHRWMAGDGFELEQEGALVTERLYIGDAVLLEKQGAVITEKYLLRDYLGSVEVVMDADATDGASVLESVLSRNSFDAYGRNRGANWLAAANQSSDTDQGFTGHRMLDSFGLVHMNGRVYDQTIGRFASPDIVIQSPYSSQSYNRYSYVMNGPLGAVDPSGYFWTLTDDDRAPYAEPYSLNAHEGFNVNGQLPEFWGLGTTYSYTGEYLTLEQRIGYSHQIQQTIQYTPSVELLENTVLSRVDCVVLAGGCNFDLDLTASDRPGYYFSGANWETLTSGFSQVQENESNILTASEFTGVDANLIRATMHYESGAGGVKDSIAGPLGIDRSIQPMNIRPFWAKAFGMTASDLRDPALNVLLGAKILYGIKANMRNNPSVSEIYSLYNYLPIEKVSWRGVEVQRIYDNRLWENNSRQE